VAEFNALMGDLRIVPPIEPNALLRPPTQADAWSQNTGAVGDWMAQQRAISAERGLWNDETGLPTQAGVLDAARQASMNLLLSTSAPGFKAYHGSPHSFDRFDVSKIGTGEGAQAYGHGLYFAENEGVARGYRDNLTVKPITPELKAAQDAYNKAYWDVPTGGTQAEFDAAIARRDAAQAEMRRVQTEWEAQPGPKGSMYEVNIKADPEHFLHWDKPLSEQSPHVQKVMAERFDLRPGGVNERAAYLASLPNDELRAVATKALDNPNILGDAPEFTRLMKEAPDIDHNAVWDIQRAALHPEGWGSYSRQPTTMGDIYRDYLGRSPEVSAQLRDAGIPGIRYLDQGSRGAGEGSHNAVVFDDATIEILRKYGLAGLMLGGGAAAAGSQQQ
jgi:hypothetical protein